MPAALDVHYDEPTNSARAAAVVFEHWEDAAPVAEYTAHCPHIEPYQPGQFYKRELPCLLAVLKLVHEPLHFLIIDGYVTLGPETKISKHKNQISNNLQNPSTKHEVSDVTSPPVSLTPDP